MTPRGGGEGAEGAQHFDGENRKKNLSSFKILNKAKSASKESFWASYLNEQSVMGMNCEMRSHGQDCRLHIATYNTHTQCKADNLLETGAHTHTIGQIVYTFWDYIEGRLTFTRTTECWGRRGKKTRHTHIQSYSRGLEGKDWPKKGTEGERTTRENGSNAPGT